MNVVSIPLVTAWGAAIQNYSRTELRPPGATSLLVLLQANTLGSQLTFPYLLYAQASLQNPSFRNAMSFLKSLGLCYGMNMSSQNQPWMC